MRHRYYSYLDFWFDLFEWLLADKESRNFYAMFLSLAGFVNC